MQPLGIRTALLRFMRGAAAGGGGAGGTPAGKLRSEWAHSDHSTRDRSHNSVEYCKRPPLALLVVRPACMCLVLMYGGHVADL